MKDQHIKKLEDTLAGKLFGLTKDEAHSLGICVKCKAQILGFNDETSRREYGITGFCQKCQDEFYEQEEACWGSYEEERQEYEANTEDWDAEAEHYHGYYSEEM